MAEENKEETQKEEVKAGSEASEQKAEETQKSEQPQNNEQKTEEKKESSEEVTEQNNEKKAENQEEGEKNTESKTQKNKEENQEKTEAKEKQNKKQTKEKKDYAVVNGRDLPLSTKQCSAICKFIKNKKIKDAIRELEEVEALRKPVPMKGEIPHKKEIMSGKYPKKASRYFIKLLKNLSANSIANGVENPVIDIAKADIAPRPMGKFGKWERKRSHIKITVKESKSQNKKKNG